MIAEFTEFNNMSNWVHGTVGDCIFEAKLFDDGSEFGIDNGRVSKLSIRDNDRAWIVNYDRGWDIEPETEYDKEIFIAVMDLLENSPRRFD